MTDTNEVRVYVTAKPKDGEANEAVIALIAKALRLAPSKLQIVRGHTAREKWLRISDLPAEQAIVALRKATELQPRLIE